VALWSVCQVLSQTHTRLAVTDSVSEQTAVTYIT